jgi:hypothetical protein
MKRNAIFAAVLALTACGKEKAASGDNATVETAAPDHIVAGLYRQATTLLDLKDSSLEYAQAAAAAKAIGTTQTADRCVTPEMVNDPQKLVRENADPACTVEQSRWTGGKIDFAMTCPESDERMGGRMSVAGTYDAHEYHFEMSATGEGDDRMKMRVDAKRLGDCKA